MPEAVIYCKPGQQRDKISKALAPYGVKCSFTLDPTGLTQLISEINPVLFILDWASLDASRNAQMLRGLDHADRDSKVLKVICCEEPEPTILAIASETAVRKVLTYPGLVLEFKKIIPLLQMGPSDSQKFAGELRRLREAGKPVDADALVEKAYAKDKSSADIRIEYANLILLRGELDAAFRIATELLQEDISNVRAMNILSRIAMKNGDFSGATEALERANVLSPKNPERLALLGNAYYGKGDKKSASAAFAECLKEDPKNRSSINGMGQIKLEEGNTQALVEFFSAHNSEAETAGFFNNAAVQNVREGKLEESLKLYEIALSALKSDHFKAQIYFNIALNYRRLKRYSDAHRAIKRSIKYDGTLAKAQVQLKEIEAIMATKKTA